MQQGQQQRRVHLDLGGEHHHAHPCLPQARRHRQACAAAGTSRVGTCPYASRTSSSRSTRSCSHACLQRTSLGRDGLQRLLRLPAGSAAGEEEGQRLVPHTKLRLEAKLEEPAVLELGVRDGAVKQGGLGGPSLGAVAAPVWGKRRGGGGVGRLSHLLLRVTRKQRRPSPLTVRKGAAPVVAHSSGGGTTTSACVREMDLSSARSMSLSGWPAALPAT